MSEPSEIRFLGDLQRIEVKPGDKFVLQVDFHPTAEMVGRFRDVWRAVMGDDVPLLVLEKGAKLGVVSLTQNG